MSCVLSSAFLSAFIVSADASAYELAIPLVPSLSPAQAPAERLSPATGPNYPWKTDIVATVFWVGELPTQNNPVPNTMSSWDTRWLTNFGGYDDPDPGNRAQGYRPIGFRPKQNPFYVALPYNDVLNSRVTKPDAEKIIPWFKESFRKPGKSVCHNRWLAIHYRGRVCYAQWSDCGPFTTQDASYVFGSTRPSNTKNGGAGIDISPAVRDFLEMGSGAKCDWRFVDLEEVGAGPWTHYGTNNPFAPKPPAAPEPADAPVLARKSDTVFTATYKVSTMRPVTTKLPATKTSKRATTNSSPKAQGASRLDDLRRVRDQWFDKK